jgi:hypothetical protein
MLRIVAYLCILIGLSFGANGQVTPADSVIVPWNVLITGDAAFHYFVEDTSKYTYEMIQEDVYYFEKHWPQYVTVNTIGYSEFGLPITMMTLRKGQPKKHAALIVGNIHAREDFSSKLAMKFTNVFLLSLDGLSSIYPKANSVLDAIDVYVIPVANPDGMKIAHEEFNGIEDSLNCWFDSIYKVGALSEWKANGKGVDLNSSFDDGNWQVKRSGNYQAFRASEGYKGAIPAEAVETKVLQKIVDSLRPLTTVSLHTKGNVLFWADIQTHDQFRGIDTEMAKAAEMESGFKVASVAKMPNLFGAGLENYVRSRIGGIGVCVELSEGGNGRAQHPDAKFNELVWYKAWRIPMIYLEKTVDHRETLQAIQQQFLIKTATR